MSITIELRFTLSSGYISLFIIIGQWALRVLCRGDPGYSYVTLKTEFCLRRQLTTWNHLFPL